MKLKEFLTGKSIFTALATVTSIPVITQSSTLLDSMLNIQYGERELFPAYSEVDIDIVAAMMGLQMGQQWEFYIQAEATLENIHNEMETTTSKDATTNATGERSDLNTVAAYNTAEQLNKDGSNSTSADETINNEEIVSKVVDKNIERAYNLLSTSAKNSVNAQILADVAKFLTLDIY